MRFSDRVEAGSALAVRLRGLGLADPVVLALPRGGVPVAEVVARALDAPLDVLLVRKVGAPHQPELGVGAIAEGGTLVVHRRTLDALGIGDADLRHGVEAERRELERRQERYRAGREPLDVRGRDVVVVDDGLATGVTAEAALRDVLARAPRSLTLAVPVCAGETADRLGEVADHVVCALVPPALRSVGEWYERFDQTSDEEVVRILDRSGPGSGPHAGPADAGSREPPEERPVVLAVDDDGGATVAADLVVPPGARGLVVFAHGSGSSRRSSRNRLVAAALQERGLATLLLDLLTAPEEAVDQRTRHLRFDIGLLADRLVGALDWAGDDDATADLPVGLFGASTGAAAALVAAARVPERVGAVVSRGGRPDLAGSALAHVRAPTLLVVGGADLDVLSLNRQAAERLAAPHALEVVPGATHLFPEPGALEHVAELAGEWFVQHLVGTTARR